MKNIIEDISSQLLQIASDRVSGSTQMLQNLVTIIEQTLSQNIDIKIFKKELENITTTQHQFTNLYIITNKILNNINNNTSIKKIITEIKEYYNTLAHTHYIKLRPYLPDKNLITILTHSNSSSVKSLLLKLKNEKNLQIIQPISYPGEEGLVQAKFLKENSINVTIIDDAAIPFFAKQSDIAIIGCDTIGKDFFVNKVGSFSTALSAQYYNIPLIVLGDKYKQNNNFEEQLNTIKNHNITKKEIILEKVPIRLATKIIS